MAEESDVIRYPVLTFIGLKMGTKAARHARLFTVKGVLSQRTSTQEICDVTGHAFRVGNPRPERRITLMDRLLNRYIHATYGTLEPLGQWSLDKLKKKVVACIEADADFWDETKPIVLWKQEVEHAKTYAELIELFV